MGGRLLGVRKDGWGEGMGMGKMGGKMGKER